MNEKIASIHVLSDSTLDFMQKIADISKLVKQLNLDESVLDKIIEESKELEEKWETYKSDLSYAISKQIDESDE